MKKIILFTICLMSFALSSFAQLPTGEKAPEWTSEDLNGEEHEMFSVLNEHKSVVLDISATWCGPCWSYHTSGVLEETYEEYGPEGTDEMMIYFIEGDGATSIDDLYGNGTNTLGDWVSGTPYPIIDDASIYARYRCTYFPTLFHVCPDRTLRLIDSGERPSTPEEFHAMHNECRKIVGTNNVSINEFTEYSGETCGTVEYEPMLSLQNMGAGEITSMTIEIMKDGELYETQNWTGNMSTYDCLDLDVTPITADENFTVDVNIVSINGVADEDPTDNSISTEILIPKTGSNSATLKIQTDGFGNELHWILFGENGNFVARGGNQAVGLGVSPQTTHNAPAHSSAYPNNTLIEEPIDISSNECYTIIITDYFGDGICCEQGAGSFQMVDDQGNILFEVSDFGSSKQIEFTTFQTTNIDETLLNEGMSIAPNPTDGEILLSYELNEASDVNITISDIKGQVISSDIYTSQSAGKHRIEMDLQAPNGVYFVSIKSDNAMATQKLVLNK